MGGGITRSLKYVNFRPGCVYGKRQMHRHRLTNQVRETWYYHGWNRTSGQLQAVVHSTYDNHSNKEQKDSDAISALKLTKAIQFFKIPFPVAIRIFSLRKILQRQLKIPSHYRAKPGKPQSETLIRKRNGGKKIVTKNGTEVEFLLSYIRVLAKGLKKRVSCPMPGWLIAALVFHLQVRSISILIH